MSDLAWIALIIIVYQLLIRPLMQGMVQSNKGGNGTVRTDKSGPHRPEQQRNKGDDYVDYEEIK